jgi:hypothetical protein
MKRAAFILFSIGLFSLGLSPVFGSAQDLAFGGPAKPETTGVRVEWSKQEDFINGSISKDKLVKMKEVTGALVNFLKDSCLGAGGYSPSWRGEYNSDKNSPGAQLKFGVNCHFAGQNADLSITANDIGPLLDQLVVNGQHFLTMRVASASDQHNFYYADGSGSGAAAGQTKMWLVTAGKGQLPFIAVTRKEYLVEAKAELSAMVKSIEAGWKLKVPVRPAAVQDAERKAVIDQLKSMYSGTDLAIRARVYLQSYKSDEEFLKANIAAETAGFRATMRLMDSMSARFGAAELAKPAVVSVGAADFRGFEDGQSNYMLIRMNDAYFSKTLSDEVPQVFLVTWHYDGATASGANASALELDRRLTAKLDGRVLQEMLNK